LFFLLSKRANVDLAFFFGSFLVIESVSSLSWLTIFNIDNYPGAVITLQNYFLVFGLLLTIASLLFMSFGFPSWEAKRLPSKGLMNDFAFVIGAFLSIAGLTNIDATGGISFVGYEATISFTFLGVALLGLSVYVWSRQQLIDQVPIGWEIWTTVLVALIIILLFVLPTGQVVPPVYFVQQNYIPLPIFMLAAVFFAWSIVGAKPSRQLGIE
jgi:hypothetical protein